jgi:hypothetical protein
MIERQEHPWVTRRSCIAYGFARLLCRDDFYRFKDAGLLKLQAPIAPDLLQRIREGAARSPYLKIAFLNILKRQGLVPNTPTVEEDEQNNRP